MVQLLGTVGATVTAIGGLAGGATPLRSPLSGALTLPLLGRNPLPAVSVTIAGAYVLCLAWLLMARYAMPFRHHSPRRTQMSERQVWSTLLCWMIPLSLTLPLYSKDVYSYAAFGSAAHHGLDVYSGGPQELLGQNNIFSDNVPSEWRNTPAQYGVGFVLIARTIAYFTGEHLMLAIVCYRILGFISILILSWSIRRLALRFGVQPVAAIWLGILNPVTLLHIVGGIHNEAIMVALIAAGFEFCLAGLSRPKENRNGLWLFIIGVVFISLAGAIKLPAVLALAFVGIAAARKRGGRVLDVVWSALLCSALLGAVFVILTWISGSSYEWITSTGAATNVPSYLSISNDIAFGSSEVGKLLGLGDRVDTLREIIKYTGIVVASGYGLRSLWLVEHGRRNPLAGYGFTMLVVLMCFPVVQPWYLLWALIPLASWVRSQKTRFLIVVVSVILAVVPMPQGGAMPATLVYEAVGTALLLFVVTGISFQILVRPSILRQQPTRVDS